MPTTKVEGMGEEESDPFSSYVLCIQEEEKTRRQATGHSTTLNMHALMPYKL
jgi:hypothetical protein